MTTRVFIALDLQALVTIETDGPIPIPAAIELISTTLLQRYGIELRATGHGETFAAWSTDPKYPHNSDPPMTQAERDALPKRRIRIIKMKAVIERPTPPDSPKHARQEGCAAFGAGPRCSLGRDRCGYARRSRLATQPKLLPRGLASVSTGS